MGNGSNSVTLGNTSITKTILNGNVGIGTTGPGAKLEVSGARAQIKITNTNASGVVAYIGNGAYDDSWLRITTNGASTYRDLAIGKLYIGTSGGAYANTLCSSAVGSGTVGSCSSSIRYKKDIAEMNLGLDTVLQLNPVTFNWKYNDQSDYGFLAEDLEKIDPMLVFYKDGQVEGVKYDRLTAVLANAIQEQQLQINSL
ncbi:hypothetical protein COX68_03685, partial [Candidatus Falkowbacteria bacterium CG_4_10_14_0_2_um_filter_41_15]